MSLPLAGLRARLILLVLLALLPPAALIVANDAERRELIAAGVTQELQQVVRLASATEERYQEGAHQLLIALANNEKLRGEDEVACTTYLAELVEQEANYLNFSVVAADGSVLCSALPFDSGLNLADRAWFQRVMSSQTLAMGDYEIGPISERPTVGFGYPIVNNNGEPDRVLMAALDLRWLEEFASEVQLPAGSTLTVILQDGRTLWSYPEPASPPRELATATTFFQQLAAGNDEVIKARAADGVPSLYISTGLGVGLGTDGVPSAYLVLRTPESTALASADISYARDFLWLVWAAALAVGVAWFSANRLFVRPIQALANTAGKLAAGDMSARTHLKHGSGEVGELTRAFDEMAASLERRALARQQAEEESQRAATRAEALARIAARLNAQQDVQTLLQTVCEEAVHALGASAAVLSMYERGHNQFRPTAVWGLPDQYLEELRPYPASLYDTFAARAKARTFIVPASQHGSELPNRDVYQRYGIHTLVVTLLQREEQTVGVLTVYSLEPRTWDAGELAFMQGVADQAAQAITNAGLYSETRRRLQQLRALQTIAVRLNAQLDLETLLETVMTEAARALDVPAASILLYNAGRNQFILADTLGLPSKFREQLLPIPYPSHASFKHQSNEDVFLTPETANLPDIPNKELYLRCNIRTIAGAALKRDQQPVGMLGLYTFEPRTFTDDDLALLNGIANQAAQAITNARLFSEAQRRLQQLHALHSIDLTISSSLDLQSNLHVILEHVTAQLEVDAAAITLLNPQTLTLEHPVVRGFRGPVPPIGMRLGEGYSGRAALERCTIHVTALPITLDNGSDNALRSREGFVGYSVTPLLAKGEVKGVLEIFHRAPLEANEERASFLETLAGQTAIAIDNAELFNSLQRSNAELTLAYETTIEGWSRALDLRDKETEGHSLRVTEMTLRLARAMGVSAEELVHIRRGALLHDIGKLGIPDEVLLKPGPLTDEEWKLMRTHPTYAYRLLSPIAFLQPALDIPYCHHEKWDGTGYPRKLIGAEIPLSARIFAVVDVWDALRSDRPYRSGWPEERVLTHIQENSGSHFDPLVVEVFLQMVTDVPAKSARTA